MKQLKISLLILLIFTVLCGIVYPFLMTAIGILLFPGKSGGSLITGKDSVKGSFLIGQSFKKPGYFHGRPSAVGYNSSISGGSNYGPVNKKFIDEVKERALAIRREDGIDEKQNIPSDLLFASGSGLDPHISVESALLQSGRVAVERNMSIPDVVALIESHKERQLPFYGRSFVNVVKLNRALDAGGVIK